MFKASTLYDWLSDYDAFKYEFLRNCNTLAQAFNLRFEYDHQLLKLNHECWIADSEHWRTQHFPHETDALSPIKLVALLLQRLSSSPFISAAVSHKYTSDVGYKFDGSQADYDVARADIIAAREAVLSFDFCLSIICWYEMYRTDRDEPFKFRLTKDLRHDVLSYLVSRQTDPKSLYLFFEALFIRSKKV